MKFINKIAIPTGANLNIDTTSLLFEKTVLTLTGTLTADVDVSFTGTAKEGQVKEFYYLPDNPNTNGFTLTVFDQDFTDFNEAILITAVYVNAAWNIIITKLNLFELVNDSIATFYIQNEAVTGSKIADGSITLEKLAPGFPTEYPITVLVDASTNELKDTPISVRIPHSHKILSYAYCVLEDITADALNINVKVDNAELNSFGFNIPSGTPTGGRSTNTAADISVTGANWIKVVPAKVTAGGKVLLTIIVDRI